MSNFWVWDLIFENLFLWEILFCFFWILIVCERLLIFLFDNKYFDNIIVSIVMDVHQYPKREKRVKKS